MPIYAYKCGSCGHAKDVLQKISDAPLTLCPACGAEQFSKQITAAGFQLKGSGWYATDFRGGNNGSANGAKPATESKPADSKPATDSKPADSGKTESSTPASTKPGTPSASAGGCGSSCGCH
jgi:putative FmdB family regulatory protein